MTLRSAAVGLLLLATAACDESATGPSATAATTETRIAGDAPPAANEAPAAEQDTDSPAVEGSLEVEARVYLQNESGAWVMITDGSAEQTLDASAEGGFRLLGRSEIEAGSYNRVRVEFERVEGEVTGGLAIELGGSGVGISLGAAGGAPLVVEREIDLEARAGSVSQLEIDLNAHEWAEAAASTGVIGSAALAGAVDVAVR